MTAGVEILGRYLEEMRTWAAGRGHAKDGRSFLQLRLGGMSRIRDRHQRKSGLEKGADRR